MIVSYEHYTNVYMGEPISAQDFPRAEAKAERLVNQITHGRAADFAALPSLLQGAVMDAICAQVEYYALMGTDISVTGDTGGNGWHIGEMSINGTSGGGSSSRSALMASMVAPGAIAALEQTGLMNPQAPVVEACPWPRGWGC